MREDIVFGSWTRDVLSFLKESRSLAHNAGCMEQEHAGNDYQPVLSAPRFVCELQNRCIKVEQLIDNADMKDLWRERVPWKPGLRAVLIDAVRQLKTLLHELSRLVVSDVKDENCGATSHSGTDCYLIESLQGNVEWFVDAYDQLLESANTILHSPNTAEC